MVSILHFEHHIFILQPLAEDVKLPESTDQSELKKGIAYLVDHCHLFTSHFMVQIVINVSTFSIGQCIVVVCRLLRLYYAVLCLLW